MPAWVPCYPGRRWPPCWRHTCELTHLRRLSRSHACLPGLASHATSAAWRPKPRKRSHGLNWQARVLRLCVFLNFSCSSFTTVAHSTMLSFLLCASSAVAKKACARPLSGYVHDDCAGHAALRAAEQVGKAGQCLSRAPCCAQAMLQSWPRARSASWAGQCHPPWASPHRRPRRRAMGGLDLPSALRAGRPSSAAWAAAAWRPAAGCSAACSAALWPPRWAEPWSRCRRSSSRRACLQAPAVLLHQRRPQKTQQSRMLCSHCLQLHKQSVSGRYRQHRHAELTKPEVHLLSWQSRAACTLTLR